MTMTSWDYHANDFDDQVVAQLRRRRYGQNDPRYAPQPEPTTRVAPFAYDAAFWRGTGEGPDFTAKQEVMP